MEHVETRIHVSDLQELTAFYATALKPAGIQITAKSADKTAVGFGYTWALGLYKREPFFVLVDTKVPLMKPFLNRRYTEEVQGDNIKLEEGKDEDLGLMEAAYLEPDEKMGDGAFNVSRDVHIRFDTDKWEAIDEFERITSAAGAKVILPAAYRPKHGMFHYGVTIQDPDGRTVEMVCTIPKHRYIIRGVFWSCYFAFIYFMFHVAVERRNVRN